MAEPRRRCTACCRCELWLRPHAHHAHSPPHAHRTPTTRCGCAPSQVVAIAIKTAHSVEAADGAVNLAVNLTKEDGARLGKKPLAPIKMGR